MTTDETARVTWRKSMRSNGSGNCVEVAEIGDGIAVRDSKDPAGPTLHYTRAEWAAFIGAARDGRFDNPA